MKITGHEDLRVQRTIKNIQTAFKQLICEKRFEQITVKELSERAQINKKTFYRYYQTLSDLLAEIQVQYSSGYLSITKGLRYPRDLAKSIQTFFEYSTSQDRAYELITVSASQSYMNIRQSMIDDVMNQTWGSDPEFKLLSKWQQQMVISFVQQTGLNVYCQWVLDGKPVPISAAIDTAIDLVHGGVNQFLK
ncbi:TetR/AcrR family transcriptional regulator [Lactobacillus sp. Sy-1]|uniref:TetR/AcrR family transcriptional regulator n=1 Tax=Lactobacillus sp. Sy-1 TaxID=2109645 RepID=UPI001C5BA677|nr:TetR/AcrR family transcriptional regulator [Lactobacillus sp. Sy-1]MBW1606417.1 TetR/AcrR family transcriptional regulator [Lactobacillus sp. Sy-1]